MQTESQMPASSSSPVGDENNYPIVDVVPGASHTEMEAEIERRSAERTAELVKERDLLRALLEKSPDHIYFKDLNSRFLRCSHTMVVKFGKNNVDEVVGKTDFDFFTEKHARPAFEDEQEIIRTGKPMVDKIEQEIWRHSGKVTWVLTNKLPLRNEAGEIIGTFGVSKDITPLKEAEAKLEQAHKELMEISRQAGMSEVATGVLHNVGNVLNSVNISADVVSDHLKKSKIAHLNRIITVMREHSADLGEFVTSDPKGRQLPDYLAELAGCLTNEHESVLKELTVLRKNIEHIKDIVSMQQDYARVDGVAEPVKVADLVEDALRMNAGALVRHEVQLTREYAPNVPEITVEKHKVLQVLVNLIRNAKYACDESGRSEKKMTVSVTNGGDSVRISVKDNGVGIPQENLTRIFNHGFTTRKTGHGFGLHSGALAARELGGALLAHSDGPDKGAVFTLELPLSKKTGS